MDEQLQTFIESILYNLMDRHDMINSKSYIDLDPDNLDCVVVVQAKPHKSVIRILFTDEIENIVDIYDEKGTQITRADVVNELLPRFKTALYNFEPDDEILKIEDNKKEQDELLKELREDEKFFEDVAGQLR